MDEANKQRAITDPTSGDIRDLTKEVDRFWDECFEVIGGELCIRCSDLRWRPIDWATGYRLRELLWSSRLIDWKLQGRTGDAPEQPPILTRQYPLKRRFARLRVWFGHPHSKD